MMIGVSLILLVGVVAVIAITSGGKKQKQKPFVPTELTADSKVGGSNKTEEPKETRSPPRRSATRSRNAPRSSSRT